MEYRHMILSQQPKPSCKCRCLMIARQWCRLRSPGLQDTGLPLPNKQPCKTPDGNFWVGERPLKASRSVVWFGDVGVRGTERRPGRLAHIHEADRQSVGPSDPPAQPTRGTYSVPHEGSVVRMYGTWGKWKKRKKKGECVWMRGIWGNVWAEISVSCDMLEDAS